MERQATAEGEAVCYDGLKALSKSNSAALVQPLLEEFEIGTHRTELGLGGKTQRASVTPDQCVVPIRPNEVLAHGSY